MRKILGINISHNCSFAYFENRTLKEYYEEDRFNKIKHFSPPDVPTDQLSAPYEYLCLKKLKDIKFDNIAVASHGRTPPSSDYPIIHNLLKRVEYKNVYFDVLKHHI